METNVEIKLGQKVNAISQALGNLKKDGKNKFSNYDYISYEQLDRELKPLLIEHNLCIIPEVTESKESVNVVKEKLWIRSTIKMNFILIDLETGYVKVVKFQGADQDTGGKSFGQAVTECCKRFYFKLFKVSSPDDNDPDGKTTEGAPNA
jgi:hypothetical protein